MAQLSLVTPPTTETEATPLPQAFEEVMFDPADSCIRHKCYDKETGVCPKLGYKITLELAKRQRLCDILDEPKKPKQARVNRA